MGPNVDYVHPVIGKHPEHGSLVGRKVTLRYLPNDLSFVDVYLDDVFVCTAVPYTRLTDAERLVIVRQRNATVQEVDTILKLSHARAQAEESEGVPQFQPERYLDAPSSKRQSDDDDYLSALEDALGLERELVPGE